MFKLCCGDAGINGLGVWEMDWGGVSERLSELLTCESCFEGCMNLVDLLLAWWYALRGQ